MPIKDGDKVYFKIQSGTIRTGKYDSKTKMVMLAGGKKAKPPKSALHHTRAGAEKGKFVKLKSSTDILGAPMKYSGKGKVPKGSHRMPDGSIMKDSDMKSKKKESTKKERRKMYYIEADMLGEEEEDTAKSVDWKVYKTTSMKTFLKKSMTKKEAERDIIWDSKDTFADYSISKKL